MGHAEAKERKAPRRGVSLAGAEFGTGPEFCNENPGTPGRDYTYNSERTVEYFAKAGFTLFRIPFRWERIQPRLGEPLDKGELERLTQTVQWIKRNKGSTILDVHNYARYRLRRQGKVVEAIIDQRFGHETPVTRDHFADLWRRLSAVYQEELAVEAYGLMNEPHDLGASDWKKISQAAVTAVREAGDRKLVLVCGDAYGNAHRFADVNGTWAWIKDPAEQTAYEAHCYFDSNASGEYKQSYDAERTADKSLEQRGALRLLHFAGWCAVNRVRGFLGEYGCPADDPRWLAVLADLLKALDQTSMEGCCWAAGEWWGENYRLSIQPRDKFRQAAPHLKVLVPG
jgi:endoglucanase